jgi:hypothetical protein
LILRNILIFLPFIGYGETLYCTSFLTKKNKTYDLWSETAEIRDLCSK